MFARRCAYRVGEEISHRFQRAYYCIHLVILAIASITSGTSAFAQSGKLSVAPPSLWVGPIRSIRNLPPQSADATTPLRWLLYQREINVKNDEQFFHLIRQVVT